MESVIIRRESILLKPGLQADSLKGDCTQGIMVKLKNQFAQIREASSDVSFLWSDCMIEITISERGF